MWFVVAPLAVIVIGLNVYVTWVSVRWSYHKIWPSQHRGDRFGAITVPFNLANDKIVGIIAVGTPNDDRDQLFNVAFNTFSSKSWLRSVELCENKDCTGKTFQAFDGRRSETYRKKDKDFKQKLGQGSEVSGFVVQDTIRFLGEKMEFFVEKQEFGEINKISGENLAGIDGILGLGLESQTNSDSHEPFVRTFEKQAQMEAVFGIYVHDKPKGSEVGRLIFGGNDQDLTTGPINVHNVVKNKEDKYTGWILPMDKAIVQFNEGGREDVQLSVNTATPAPMLDEISLPEADVTVLIGKIFAKADFQRTTRSFQCQSDWKNKLPALKFVIGGVEYVLRPEDYVVPMNQRPYGETCVVAISSSGGSKTVRLGLPFMKRFYTRFSIGTKQIQFIQAVPMP